ncbi:OBAP family protein [Adhaeribacter swui]|uniref:OBAP family protein n=1 Tax=Adhaeribacter swui TaxID=2086471 RepID=A0A7G7G3C3_9BACT|nr:OBAP family protein [Adhaeribacter swui]QNF31657.1 OBAP family protein [Adhaeribacter swui]
MNRLGLIGVVGTCILLSCGGENTSSYVKSPGAEKSTKTKVLETGADVMQDKTPLKKLNMYLDGFHFYNGNMKGQMEAHHYCTKINEDLTQCVMYDGNGENAKIMGVEYIVSEKLFRTLPMAERELWHSHAYEVKSGELIAPGIPDVAEHELMEQIVSTYGKVIHTWHTDRDLGLPMGIPQIMMGFTKDGQLDPKLLADRDARFKVKAAEKRQQRADIPVPKLVPGANAWEQGKVKQLQVTSEPNNAAHAH